MSTDKAREFWIAAPERYWHVDNGSLVCYENAAELKDFEGDTIHVVEFKAFEALQNELDHCMKNYQDLGLHISKDKNLERLQKENEALEKEIAELRKQLKWKQESLDYSIICIKSNHEKYEALETENAQLKAELEKAKSNELTNAVFAVDEKLREELAAAKSEIERLTQLDYSKEDARRNDKLGKLKIDMLEAQGYIETQDLQINALSRELQEYEHETETIKELKEQIANQAKTIDQCKPESVVALKTENQILKDAFQTASTNYPKIIDELKAENEKLKEHFDNCNADKIVTLVLERDAAIAAKKKAWEGNKQYEILVDSERAEKNAALAKAQAMEQALTSAQLVMDQALYVGSMAYPSLETFVNNAETCANEIREELAKWRGKK